MPVFFEWSNPHHPIFTCVKTDNQVLVQRIIQSDTLWGSDKKTQVMMPEWYSKIFLTPTQHWYKTGFLIHFHSGVYNFTLLKPFWVDVKMFHLVIQCAFWWKICGIKNYSWFYHNVPNGLWFIKCFQKHLGRTILFLLILILKTPNDFIPKDLFP